MEQTLVNQTISKDSVKIDFEAMEVDQKLYADFELTAASLRSEASRWNSYTNRTYRILQDEKKRLYVYRKS